MEWRINAITNLQNPGLMQKQMQSMMAIHQLGQQSQQMMQGMPDQQGGQQMPPQLQDVVHAQLPSQGQIAQESHQF